MVFDPWKNRFAANKLRDLTVKRKEAGAWNTTLANGEQAFTPTTDDKNSVLDPIAKALWNNTRKFTDELREFAAPYQVEITRSFAQYGFSTGKYIFRLKNENGTLSEKSLIFELAYDLGDSLDGFYDIIDDMIFKWEETTNNKKRDRALRSSVNAKRMNNMPLEKREQKFAEKYIDIGDFIGKESAKKRKSGERRDILCPDHGNPMMARKDSPDVLRCLVDGCIKVAKRKKPLESPKPVQTIGQKLNAVLEDAPPAALKFEGVVEEGSVKGFEPQQFILDEIEQASKNTSLAPNIMKNLVDQYNKFNLVQPIQPQQTASTVGTKQSVQLGFQLNNNPVLIHHEKNTQRVYLIQKDQQTGQDIWIDVTSAGGEYDIKTSIGGMYEVTVTLHPRIG